MNLIGLFVAVVLSALGLILLGGTVLAVTHLAQRRGQPRLPDPEMGVKLKLGGIVVGVYVALFVLHKLIDGGGALAKVLDTLFTVTSGGLFLALLISVLYWGAIQYAARKCSVHTCIGAVSLYEVSMGSFFQHLTSA